MKSPLAQNGERGLTLVELLVAVAVASIAVVPLIGVVSGQLRDAPRRAERRTAADVASAWMEEATHPGDAVPKLPVTRGVEELDGRKFEIERRVAPPGGSGLQEISVTVRRADGSEVLTLRALR